EEYLPTSEACERLQTVTIVGRVRTHSDAVNLDFAGVQLSRYLEWSTLLVLVLSVGDYQEHLLLVLGNAIQMASGKGNCIQQRRTAVWLDAVDPRLKCLGVSREVLLENNLPAERNDKGFIVLAQMAHHIGQTVYDGAPAGWRRLGRFHQDAKRKRSPGGHQGTLGADREAGRCCLEHGGVCCRAGLFRSWRRQVFGSFGHRRSGRLHRLWRIRNRGRLSTIGSRQRDTAGCVLKKLVPARVRSAS